MNTVVFTRNRQRRMRVDRQEIIRLAARALARLRSRLETLGIILVNDAQIAGYNERFHRRAGPTDILTFAYEGMGELIISTEQAIANARRFRTTPRRELALYIVHGILHLHGHDDLTPAKRRNMRAAERRLLKALL
ncbi:MAG: rRNA maturation RNase YbeY [Verrucomicrobia bacterium]|nr:rRNA maturation RNase YbeY [Verrucomicrobiota bacterium]